MRLLLVVPMVISYRGFLRELGEALRAGGAEVHVACACRNLAGEEDHGVGIEGVTFHHVNFARGMNPAAHLRAARALRRLVAELRPDLVHAHFSASVFTTALAVTNRWPTTVGTFHGLSFPAMHGWKARLLRTMETWAARRLDAVWVLTEDDCEALQRTAPGAVVNVLPGFGVGCDLETFAPVPATERAAVRARLGFVPGDVVFAFVGRFTDFKGFDLVVRAFLELLPACPTARLLLIGERDGLHPTGLSPAEDRALQGSPQVVDAGYQRDVAGCLTAADVTVFPSRREGVPVCLMESLALGVPVLTCDTRGCREVVRDGVDGRVLRERTASALRDAMQQAVEDPASRQRWGLAALAGRERFSRAHFIAAQQSAYADGLPLADAARRGYPGKRLFDVTVAALALALLSPVLVFVALLVRVKLGVPVLFKQERPGLDGRPFTLCKFRTMTDARNAFTGELRPDAERLTTFGKFLRSSSLDELPELFNVLRGEMSLVGPRPLLVAYLPFYSPEQRRRHDVLPGITGWAQVNGRNAMGWAQKFALDLWYVEHQSLWLDLRILFLTLWTVVRREGINQPGWTTSELFRGNVAPPGPSPDRTAREPAAALAGQASQPLPR